MKIKDPLSLFLSFCMAVVCGMDVAKSDAVAVVVDMVMWTAIYLTALDF